MSFGLEIRNAAGGIRLSVTDYIHRLVQSGSILVGLYGSEFVTVPGMTESDEWFVVLVGDASYFLGSGGFTIVHYDFPATIFYNVYKR